MLRNRRTLYIVLGDFGLPRQIKRTGIALLLGVCVAGLLSGAAFAAGAQPTAQDKTTAELQANFSAAQQALNKGDFNAAIANLEKDAKLAPSNAEFAKDEGLVYMDWGRSEAQKGNDGSSYFDKSIAAFDRTTNLLMQNVGQSTVQQLTAVWQQEADIYFADKHDVKGAGQLLQQAIQQLDSMKHLFGPADLSVPAAVADLQYVWGLLAQNNGAGSAAPGYYTAAIKDYDNVIGEAIKQKPRNDQLLGELWLQEADVYGAQGKSQDAIAVLKSGLKTLPTSVNLNYRLGIDLWQQYRDERSKNTDPSLDPSLTGSIQASVAYFRAAIANDAKKRVAIPYAYFFVGLSESTQNAKLAGADLAEYVAEMKTVSNRQPIDDMLIDVANTMLATMGASSAGN